MARPAASSTKSGCGDIFFRSFFRSLCVTYRYSHPRLETICDSFQSEGTVHPLTFFCEFHAGQHALQLRWYWTPWWPQTFAAGNYMYDVDGEIVEPVL